MKKFLKQLKRQWFEMVAFFLMTLVSLSSLFGVLSFTFTYYTDVYKTYFSTQLALGVFDNDLSLEESNDKFKEFEINRINEVLSNKTTFTYNNLETLYDNNGYVLFDDDLNNEDQIKLTKYANEYLGNLRTKLMSEYINNDYSISIRNNQLSALYNNTSSHLYLTDVKNNPGLFKVDKLNKSKNLIPVYVSSKQLNKDFKLGDIIDLGIFKDKEKNTLRGYVAGTFFETITFNHYTDTDYYFLLDSSTFIDYVFDNFKQYDIINYSNNGDVETPMTVLHTNKQYGSHYLDYVGTGFKYVNNLFGNNNDKSIISNNELQNLYKGIQTNFGIAVIVSALFGALILMIYIFMSSFIVREIIQNDIMSIKNLNALGVSKIKLAFNEITKMIIPFLISFIISLFASYIFSSSFLSIMINEIFIDIHSNIFEALPIVACISTLLVLIFITVFITMYKISKSLKINVEKKELNIADKINYGVKSKLKIKSTNYKLGAAFFTKNFAQIVLIFFISIVSISLLGLSLNMSNNIKNMSNISSDFYKPNNSLSYKQFDNLEEGVLKYSTDSLQKNEIGGGINLQDVNEQQITEFVKELEHPSGKVISKDLVSQIDDAAILKIDKIVNNDSINNLLHKVANYNLQIKNNFNKTGFNIMFDYNYINKSDIKFTQVFGSASNLANDNYVGLFPNVFLFDHDYIQQKYSKIKEDVKYVEAYLPIMLKDYDYINLNIQITKDLKITIPVKQVGISKEEGWGNVVSIDRDQLFKYIINNTDPTLKDMLNERYKNFYNAVLTKDNTPYFMNNIVLSGDGNDIESYINDFEGYNTFGINGDIIKTIYNQKTNQYTKLINALRNIFIFIGIAVMLITIYFVLIANIKYFKMIKMLGYSNISITNKISISYLTTLIMSLVLSLLFVYLVKSIVDNLFINSIGIYIQYSVGWFVGLVMFAIPTVYFALIYSSIYVYTSKLECKL